MIKLLEFAESLDAIHFALMCVSPFVVYHMISSIDKMLNEEEDE